MPDWRDHRPLLIGNIRARGLSHVVEEREVGTDRHVVPRHVPEPRHVQGHVVVIETALVPGRIVRRALNHPATGRDRHRVGKNAARAVHGLQDVLDGEVPQRLGPVHRWQLLRQIEGLRGADQILLRRLARKHRPDLILLTVDPGNEKHLNGAAPVPVALLDIRRDPADAGAETLHVHRRIRGVPERRDAHLILGGRRTPGRPDLAVRPRLLRQPLERVVAVGRRAEDVVVALREEMAALVLDDVGVAPLHRSQRRRQVARHAVAHVPVIEVVGRPHPDDRNLRRRILRAVDVGRQPNAVSHRHHHLALDDGNRLKLLFDFPAPRRRIRRESGPALSQADRGGAKKPDHRGTREETHRFLHRDAFPSVRLAENPSHESCHEPHVPARCAR